MPRTDYHTVIGNRGKRIVVERKRARVSHETSPSWNTLHLDAPHRRDEDGPERLVEERALRRGLESANRALWGQVNRLSQGMVTLAQRIVALEAENRNLKRAAAARLVDEVLV
jgi:hypothetical protein